MHDQNETSRLAMQLVLVLLTALLQNCRAASLNDSEIICVRPTDPPNVHCACSPPENDCYTLSEWIESGSNPFTNDTTVMLMAGIHLINSTKDRLVIENVQSLQFIAMERETTVSCVNRFSFNFIHAENVSLSNITFKYCAAMKSLYRKSLNSTLLLLETENVNISTVTIIGGGLLMYEKTSEPSTHILYDLHIVYEGRGFYYVSERVVNPYKLKNPGSMYIENCTFKLSFVDMTFNLEYIVYIDNVIIEGVIGSVNNHALYISSAKELTITDVIIQKNYSPVLFVSADIITIYQHCLLIGNIGTGAVFSAMTFSVYPETTIVVYNNTVQGNLFELRPLLQGPPQNIGLPLSWHGGYVTLIFSSNRAERGAIMIIKDSVNVKVSTTQIIFTSNESFGPDAAIMLLKSVLIYFRQANILFFNNTASSLSGGFTLISTEMYIYQNFTAIFKNNQGGDGGAMSFYKSSRLLLITSFTEKVRIRFYNNKACNRGGAIFVKDSDYINTFTRVLGNPFIKPDGSVNMQMYFLNNSAETIGNEVYGGWIDLIHKSIIMSLPQNNPYAVTSNPTRICMCIDSVPVCNITEHQTEIFPGQTFEIKAVAVGQRMGIVPSIVFVGFSDEEGSLGERQDVQSVGKQCTPLQFTVQSAMKHKLASLRPQDIGTPHFKEIVYLLAPQLGLLFKQFNISVTLKDCPPGFLFSKSLKQCLCLPLINHHKGIMCDFETYKISKPKQKWLSTTFEHINTDQHYGVVVHDQCPYDYCRSDTDSFSFHLEFPDEQCAFNRSGVLCGACQHNFSQILGTSKCTNCSNIMLLAIFPGVFLAGILLIGFLMLSNLTVSVGTINGLIFYANIIRASQPVFFPPEINTSFLSTFIAWLNLDLGIETCFYDGLDAYAKTWLQFVFPLYIWLMVIIIIVASHYSTTVSRLTPNNGLQVLATLFLLSYAKIIRVVITVFSSTLLLYPDGFKKRVWLYDGNTEFLVGKHIPLFIAALLLLILLSVPYTLSLVSIQWLQKISHYRPLFWVSRLMPLFDAYTGPYKHKHRYWTGLLLLVRVMILIIFTLNQSNDPAVNLLAIAVIAFALQAYVSFMRVYKILLHNILEIVSLLNVGFLSVATFYQLLNGKSTTTTTTISTSIGFAIFILITLYHTVQQLMSLRKVRDAKSQLSANIANVVRMRRGGKDEEQNQNRGNTKNKVTHTSVELCESLIA